MRAYLFAIMEHILQFILDYKPLAFDNILISAYGYRVFVTYDDSGAIIGFKVENSSEFTSANCKL